MKRMKRNARTVNTLFVEGRVYKPKVLLTLEQFEANLKAEKIEESWFGYSDKEKAQIDNIVNQLEKISVIDDVVKKWINNKISDENWRMLKHLNLWLTSEEKTEQDFKNELVSALEFAKKDNYKGTLARNAQTGELCYVNSKNEYFGYSYTRSK